jgi:membrane-associated phospholipid phosphatase
VLLGERFRQPNMNIALRIGADLVAIPANLDRWESHEVAQFLAVSAAVGTLMWTPNPPHPSLDVRIQNAIRLELGPVPNRSFVFWNHFNEIAIWPLIYGPMFVLGGYGLWQGDPEYWEVASLSLEAVAVGQAFHVFAKTVLGREGPEQGEGYGLIHGPLAGLRLYPSGTPSGHATTLYALVGVISTYANVWWADLLLHAGAAFLVTTLVVDDYHYASDVLWGGAMGYAVGAWVVRNRSSRFAFDSSGATWRLEAMPIETKNGGSMALGLGTAF